MAEQTLVKAIERDNRDEIQFPGKGVLVIYTGGTIGSAPKDRADPESPEIVYPWKEVKKSVLGLQNIGFRVDVVSFKDPLDSSNVGPRHWKAMAKTIEKYYGDYNGFVIAHGTDTMIYTASALSFMLVDLSKPVIITGSQIPALDKVRNDAEQNLITSLLIANPDYSRIPLVPEVCIFFRDKLIRGNRSKKLDASGYGAFDSPNYPVLGTAGDHIDIREFFVRKPAPVHEANKRPLRVYSALSTNVITIDVFPGMLENSEMFKKLFETPGLEGVVLRTYGAGNVPTEPKELLRIVEKAVQKDGIIVVNVTQCSSGDVQQGLYDTSAVLQDMGVISGQDITAEAALCKLMNIIGNIRDYPELAEKKRAICKNQAGEQACTIATTVIDNKPAQVSSKEGVSGCYRSKAVHIDEFTSDSQAYERVLIRFVGAEVRDAGKLLVKLFVNLPGEANPEQMVPLLAGPYLKSRDRKGKKQTFTFDIVRTWKTALDDPSTFTVYVERNGNRHGTLAWDRIELTLFTRE